MAISYNKMWKLLIDKNMSAADLRKTANIAPNTMTKLRRNEPVNLVIIAAEISCVQPISRITCWHRLPQISVPWTEWLIYSALNKWGRKLTVASSSNQLRMAVPLIAPQGEMVTEAFQEMPDESNQIDDLDNIDDLIADLIDLEDDNF